MAIRRSVPQDLETVSRGDLIALLNEDLAREYQAVISYVVYSQVLKGPQYMNIAAELERHAAEELAHAMLIAGQIDYLGGMPLTVAKPVKTSAKAEDMLRFDLENENETIRHYRQRVRQCEALGEFAIAEHIRDILVQEQDHQIALANALGVEIPNVTNESGTDRAKLSHPHSGDPKVKTPKVTNGSGEAIDEHSRINAGFTRDPKKADGAQTEPVGGRLETVHHD